MALVVGDVARPSGGTLPTPAIVGSGGRLTMVDQIGRPRSYSVTSGLFPAIKRKMSASWRIRAYPAPRPLRRLSMIGVNTACLTQHQSDRQGKAVPSVSRRRREPKAALYSGVTDQPSATDRFRQRGMAALTVNLVPILRPAADSNRIR
jgi:hypothetical protein